MSKTFLYFAYGSNLLAKRIHMNNPTAIRYGIGKLKNFRLDFITHSARWKGAAATIVPDEGHVVWGAIWKIGFCNLENLDRQEGVHAKIYFPFNVDVTLPNGNTLNCRVYQQTITYFPELSFRDRLPSPIYLETIISGAYESELPPEYIRKLEKIPNNGYVGDIDISLDE